jgi:LPXTG-site transpeptidase (sortase) family protein
MGVEIDYQTTANLLPNDPEFSQQLEEFNLIGAQPSWDISTGSSQIILAIIDTGVDLNHQEFQGKILTGYDFVNNDLLPQDDNGHGTNVAGIAAASGNNGTGIAGISWQTKIMPIKVLNHAGNGSYSALAAGIIFAADHGADIINLSLGGTSPSSTLENAVSYATQRGVIIVASAGNDGAGQLLYPARYPEVIAVGSVSDLGDHSIFSNTGPEIDIMAPGEVVLTTDISNTYANSTGTSIAAPFLSGAVANFISLEPTLSFDEIIGILETTALDKGAIGRDEVYGFGILQLDRAVEYIQDNQTPPYPEEPNPNQQAQELPDAGFPPNQPTIFITTQTVGQPAEMVLRIEKLHIRALIFGVELEDGKYDLNWIGDNIGFLNGTAFPTQLGNSVLTGHVINSYGNPGIFSNLSELVYEDQIVIEAWGSDFIYLVTDKGYYLPTDTSVLSSDDSRYSRLTLITCEDYDQHTQTYQSRLIIQAILVRIEN